MPHLVHRYYLTQTRSGKTTRYPSSWRMSAEEAKAHGLTEKDIVPGTTEERAEVKHQSAGRDGARSQP